MATFHERLEMDHAIRVLLVEDDVPVRDRMAEVLRSDTRFDLVGTAGTLEEGQHRCAALRPNVLLLDLKLPDGSGIGLIRHCRRSYPAMDMMVVSALGDDQTVVAAIEAGAAGYILKDSSPMDLVGCVLDLVAGRSPLSTMIARTIVRRVQADMPLSPDNHSMPALTEREFDILWGIAKGFTYAEVAERLRISRNTVMTHIKNLYRKLEVNSRSEAVFTAINRRIIKLDG